MSKTAADFRLDGIYTQRQDGFYMQRVKLPAGVISAGQARTVADVSTTFGQGTVHLTSRGSMEIHWLKEPDLPRIKQELAKTGLTSRGACGGAVRGITCGSQGAQGFPALESLAWRLHRHFTGNPRFERLPKKFKIGVEADIVGGRHLIQDVGLVLAGLADGRARYDVWIAGGLGRAPRPGFLLAGNLPEERIIPLIEAIVAVYVAHAPPPQRLKYVAAQLGQEELRRLIEAEPGYGEELPPVSGFTEHIIPPSAGRVRLILPVFAGNLTADQLRRIAEAADIHADGALMVTANQDIALLLAAGADPDAVAAELRAGTGLSAVVGSHRILRVCPGSHECRMGLAATREVAALVADAVPEALLGLEWAVSGCQNSCSQPQLAGVGIVAARLSADAGGTKSPRFDIYRRRQAGLGEKVHEGLTSEELVATLMGID